MENKNYSADAPVFLKEQDKFSRWEFAARVAQVIAKRDDPSSLVIGLYGVWGDGKTSVLNFIKESLKSEEKVICIKFNPWRFGSEDELLKGFFFTIAEALDTKLITHSDNFKDLVKNIAPHAGTPIKLSWLGNIISHFIKKINTDELKKRVEKALEKSQKRVLILIDDVDRLDKAEIQLLFKIVKLIADFKYTSYILAFDKDIVASSLQDRYASSNHKAGEAFLEKIIQIPLNLPAVNKEILKQFCYDDINNALALAEIELTEQQVNEFVRYCIAFDEQLCTPRKAKLYGNTLLFSLPILKGEVNPVDLMLIEGIRIFYPSLYEVIRNNKQFFTGTFYQGMYSNNQPEIENIKNILNPIIDSQHNTNKEKIIDLLEFLFPKLSQVYRNTYYSSGFYSTWDNAQRICSENYFSRYFSYSIPNDDISDLSISFLLLKIESWQSPFNEDDNPLNNLLNTNNAEKIIQKLRNKAKSLSSYISYPLAIAISQKSILIPNPEILYSFLTTLVKSAMLSSDLIQNVEKDKRSELVYKCIDVSSSLEFKIELFRWLSREDNERPEKEYFSEELLDQFGTYLGENIIKKYMSHNEDITIDYPRILSLIFYILHKYVGEDVVNEYVMRLISRDPIAIVRLLTAYVPTAWSDSGKHKSDFDRSHYKDLAEKLDMSIFIKIIGDNFPHLQDIPNDYPRNYERENQNEGELFIQQFLWLHNHPEDNQPSE